MGTSPFYVSMACFLQAREQHNKKVGAAFFLFWGHVFGQQPKNLRVQVHEQDHECRHETSCKRAARLWIRIIATRGLRSDDANPHAYTEDRGAQPVHPRHRICSQDQTTATLPATRIYRRRSSEAPPPSRTSRPSPPRCPLRP